MSIAAVSVFADTVIKALVENFDFSKMDVTDNTREDYLHVGLAPSYGKLKDSDDVKALDEDLLVMTASALKDLENIKERTFDNVLSSFMQNTIMEQDGEPLHRSDRLIKTSNDVFKFDGSPDAAIVQEVMGWFKKLISDNDVLESSHIRIEKMADIVAQTGATIDSVESLIYKKEQHSKDMVDIGVICFPDADRPFFQLYRIKLTAWSSSKRLGAYQEDSNGIVGEYISRKFKPRKSILDHIDAATKKRASEQALKKLQC